MCWLIWWRCYGQSFEVRGYFDQVWPRGLSKHNFPRVHSSGQLSEVGWDCPVIMKSLGRHWLWICPWWRHQMETFSALLAICAGNSPVPGEFPTQRPVTRSFDVFFDLRLNKRLSKQSWGWWLETLSRPLWRHRNAICHSRTTHRRLNLEVSRG